MERGLDFWPPADGPPRTLGGVLPLSSAEQKNKKRIEKKIKKKKKKKKNSTTKNTPCSNILKCSSYDLDSSSGVVDIWPKEKTPPSLLIAKKYTDSESDISKSCHAGLHRVSQDKIGKKRETFSFLLRSRKFRPIAI